MSQQNTGGFGQAYPVSYGPQNDVYAHQEEIDIKDPEPDLTPSDSQPPGVDKPVAKKSKKKEEKEPESLEEALLGE